MNNQNEVKCYCALGSNRTTTGHTHTKHTPTPWKITDSTKVFGNVDIVSDVRQYPIAVTQGDNGKIEAEANAAFIVKAVNSHEALLEATKEALEYMNDDIGYEPINTRLRNAIAQAEGK